MNEFIQAAAIMINFHRLAAIVESLRYTLKEDIGEQQNENIITYDPQEKEKLYNNLLKMNDESENDEKKGRKLSDDEKVDIVYKLGDLNTNDFSKFISNFCTIYLDFDSYSDNLLSSYVTCFNFRNLTGWTRGITYSPTSTQKA
jgi:hypothetical protein